MNTFLNYFVPGISDGSVYALCALGMVLTYKTSGVFNFAYGAHAAVGAYVFYEFHDLPSRPWLKHILPSALQGPYPWPVAFLLGLLIVGVLGGLLLERLAALLAAAPTVMIVVATVGLLVMLQGADDRYLRRGRPAHPRLPADEWIHARGDQRLLRRHHGHGLLPGLGVRVVRVLRPDPVGQGNDRGGR